MAVNGIRVEYLFYKHQNYDVNINKILITVKQILNI